MRRIVKLVVSICMAIVMLAPVSIPFPGTISVAQAATTVKISEKVLSLEIGESYTLQISGTKKKVTWKTGDSEIATVSKSGKVIAVSEGKTKITAMADKKKYYCMVTVTRPENPYVTNASFDAVEKTVGEVSFVVPSDWDYEEVKANEGYYEFKLVPKGKISRMQATIQNIAINKMDYAQVKEIYSKVITQDYIVNSMKSELPDPVVSNFITFDFTYSNGQAFAFSYDVVSAGISVKQTGYFVVLEKCILGILVSELPDDTDINTYAEYLINSIR